MGFVETRHGSGTYVRSPDPDDAHAPWLMLSRDVDEYEELIEARQLIEAQILRLAAKRRTEKDLARLTEIVGRMTEARCEAYAFLAADLEFHIALADASHNRVLNRAMQAIRGPLTRVQANRAIADVERDGNLDRPIADHREIVEALAQGSDRTGPLERIVGRAEAMLDQLRAQQPQGEPPAAWCLSDSQARPQAL
jgi:DNA-binding FadR family transcriptional regulator